MLNFKVRLLPLYHDKVEFKFNLDTHVVSQRVPKKNQKRADFLINITEIKYRI